MQCYAHQVFPVLPSIWNVVVPPGYVRERLPGAGGHRGRGQRYPVFVGDACPHLGVLVVANLVRFTYSSVGKRRK